MKKNQCKEALEIYKTFLNRMTKLSEFLKVAEVTPVCPAAPPQRSQRAGVGCGGAVISVWSESRRSLLSYKHYYLFFFPPVPQTY